MTDTRNFLPGETVCCRFTREAFTVVSCNGSVAILRDIAGNETGRIVGEITREPQLIEGARAGIIEALGGLRA